MSGSLVTVVDPTTAANELKINADGSINTTGAGGTAGAVTSTDGALVTIGTTTDASSALTLVGILKNIKAALAGTLGISNKAQTSSSDTLQNGVTSATANGSVATTDGYDGQTLLFIANGAGTATVTAETSLDAAFTTAQETVVPGLVKLWDSGGGTNTSRAIVSGVVAVAANTSYLYSVQEVLTSFRGRISAGSALGAGSSETGLTVKLYRMPV